MRIRIIPTFFLILFVLFPSFHALITKPISSSYTGSCYASPSRVPAGALWYYLNTSSPSLNFTTSDFVPEQPHICYYSIKVRVTIWIEGSVSTSDLRIRNLWNSCDIVYVMNYERGFDQSFLYSYHRPTVKDPDFAVTIELHNRTGKTSGWILMDFENDGSKIRPFNFVMPSDQECESILTISSIQSHESINHSSNDSVFPVMVIIYMLMFLSITKMIYRYKNKF